jgi:UDP-N-acetylglucosamine 2-epimerase (non-hydrolysing)
MLLVSYGTRPEWIKIEPVLRHLKCPHKKLFTGQHKDIAPGCEHSIEIADGCNRLDSIVSSIIGRDDIYEGITRVLVQGDTTSAFAVALGAFHRKIEIFHLEAGLRTHNKNEPYPEEFNRRSISAMADYHFCPTEENEFNLKKEGVRNCVYVVGNTVLDNLVGVVPYYGDYILVTLHRRENHSKIKRWFEEINKIGKTNKVILPIHPNPNVKKHAGVLENVEVVEPMDYKEFIKLLSGCRYVISDSGGIQEEASFLGKRVIVCRTSTERNEGIGNHLLCYSPEELLEMHACLNINYVPAEEGCPFGDGVSGQRVARIINERFNNNDGSR